MAAANKCAYSNFASLVRNIFVVKGLFVVIMHSLFYAYPVDGSESVSGTELKNPKLLILVLDGFRWDFYENNKQHLPGFRKLLKNGVYVEYVEPIFPSVSFPSWTTLSTGLYPSSHRILGNYMIYLEDKDQAETEFDLENNSTRNSLWWKHCEPMWTTVTKAGLKSYMFNFANCDVPFDGVLPTECRGFVYQDPEFKLRQQLNNALSRIQDEYSFAAIYDSAIDKAAHEFGPDSKGTLNALMNVDILVQEMLFNLENRNLEANLIITSDHGMANLETDNGVKYVKVDEYATLDDIYKVIDHGAVVAVTAMPGKAESVYQQLSRMPGVETFRKDDEMLKTLNYYDSKLTQDILLIAQPGYSIVGVKGRKQLPVGKESHSIQPYKGGHGYKNFSDMRGIFFARGPAFKKGLNHPPIKLVDIYQIFMHVMGVPARAHNGTWDSVKNMFVNTN